MRSWPSLPARMFGLAAVLAALVGLPGVAGAEEAQSETADATQPQEAEQAAGGLALAVVPIVGDGPEDGDLTSDPELGLPTLTFSPVTASEQVAVMEFTVTNTGDTAVTDVAITDDRIGSVLDPATGTSLAPGEAVTVRASATYTYDQAIAGTAGLITTGARSTASTAPDATIEATATSTIQIVAVLATPAADLVLDVVAGEGDVVAGIGGVPTITWSAEEAAADEPRTLVYRATITNTGDVPLQGVGVVVMVLEDSVTVTSDVDALAPGEQTALDAVVEVLPDDLPGDASAGIELVARADLQASDAEGQPVAAAGQAVVLATVVAPAQLEEETAAEEELPAAGLDSDRGDLLVAAVLLVLLGADLLWVTRPRTVAAGRPRPRR